MHDWTNEPVSCSGRVTHVDDHSVSLDDGHGFGWNKDAGPPPQVGDHVRVLGEYGYEFYGFVLNDRLVWFLTPEQRAERRARWLADNAQRKRDRFEAARDRLDADYESLPPVLQRRIDQLRAAGGEEWRVDSESYEMFVCTQAAAMAEHFESVDALRAWADLPYDQQRAGFPGLDDGHSGNTFGAACHLAGLLLDGGVERAVVMPQAISPISGDPRYPR